MTETVAEHTPLSGVTAKSLAEGRSGATERAVELGAIDWLSPAAADGAPCDSRIPAPISAAFRRAVRRMRAEWELHPACDVVAADQTQAFWAVCDALRNVYTHGRCAPISDGPVALAILGRLRRVFVEEIDVLRASLKAGELSQAIDAFDHVRDAIDRDETRRFVAALESGEALDLVLEIAHDMRSPLTAILMLTEMVRRAQTDVGDDVHARQLGLVYSAAFGLNGLVNDVIALARGGDRLIDRDPVPFSTSALMHSVADMVRPIAEERKLALRLTTPAVDGRIGQPIALSRILLNLASNALQYTETGEVAMSAVDLRPALVRFEVADTGPGIPPEVMPSLFEPFGKRLTAHRSRRFSRTGLGLAICRKLLRDLGSELQVETTPGEGTRFFFELELDVADDGDVPEATPGRALL